MIDFKATLVDGASHDVDSSVLAFEIAARAVPSAKASSKGGPVLMEPIMRVEIVTPKEYMGDINGDVNEPARHRSTGVEEPRQCRGHLPPWCRWPTCSATSTPCDR